MSNHSDLRPLRPTARDLLVAIAGRLHSAHTVVSKKVRTRTTLITCVCGQRFLVPNDDKNRDALRNVPEKIVQ